MLSGRRARRALRVPAVLVLSSLVVAVVLTFGAGAAGAATSRPAEQLVPAGALVMSGNVAVDRQVWNGRVAQADPTVLFAVIAGAGVWAIGAVSLARRYRLRVQQQAARRMVDEAETWLRDR